MSLRGNGKDAKARCASGTSPKRTCGSASAHSHWEAGVEAGIRLCPNPRDSHRGS